MRLRNSDSARRELLGNMSIGLQDFMGPSCGHLNYSTSVGHFGGMLSSDLDEDFT